MIYTYSPDACGGIVDVPNSWDELRAEVAKKMLKFNSEVREAPVAQVDRAADS